MKILLRLIAPILLATPALALAGNLDSPAAPTAAGSAMFSLESLYQRLSSGAPGALRAGPFVEPLAGPTAGTGHSLNEIMGLMPAAVPLIEGALPSDVSLGRKFWGLTNGAWGLKTGTAENLAPLQIHESYVSGISAPSVPYAGESVLTISGSFQIGPQTTVAVLDENGVSYTITRRENNLVQFTKPPNTQGLKFRLVLDGSEVSTITYVAAGGGVALSRSPLVTVDYPAPVITNISGGNDEPPNSKDYPVSNPLGTYRLLITGTNLGTSNSVDFPNFFPSVSVGGLSFPVLGVSPTGDSIVCDVASLGDVGEYFDLPVVVTVNGKKGTAPGLLSYAGPQSDPLASLNDPEASLADPEGSLNKAPPAAALTVSNPLGVNTVHVKGNFFSLDGEPPVVKIGLASTPFNQKPYTGTVKLIKNVVVNGVLGQTVAFDNTEVSFTLPAGAVGKDLVVQIYNYLSIGRNSLFTISYPAPVIAPGTIRPALAHSSGTSGTITANALNAGRVYLDATGLGNNPALLELLLVTEAGAPTGLKCSALAIEQEVAVGPPVNFAPTLSGMIPQEASGAYRLVVRALNQDSAPSADTLTYTLTPTITSVTLPVGSPASENLATGGITGVPTSGGILATIQGANFDQGLPSVLVGSKLCTISAITATTLTVVLPEGSGINQLLRVLIGANASPSAALISYQAPAVTRVSGGTDVGNTTINLNPLGGQPIVVEGTNFGAAGAKVLIGGIPVTAAHDPASPHSKLLVTTPARTALPYANLPLIVIGPSGDLSPGNLAVSYEQ